MKYNNDKRLRQQTMIGIQHDEQNTTTRTLLNFPGTDQWGPFWVTVGTY